MLRSEDVSMVRLYVSPDLLQSTLEELGEKELIHLIGPKRKTQAKSQHRMEMEKILSRVDFLALEVAKREIQSKKDTGSIVLGGLTVDETVSEVNKHYYRAAQLVQILKETAHRVEQKKEDVSVLQELERAFTEGSNDFDIEKGVKSSLEYVAGVIKRREVNTLEEFLWKSLHGNLYFFSIEMSSPERAGFICFTHGERAISRIISICNRVGARIVKSKKENALLHLSADLSQLEKVHQMNTESYTSEILTISREIPKWRYLLLREIEIEAAKEKFTLDERKKYFLGEGFIVARNEERFGKVLKRLSEAYEGDVEAEIVPAPEEVSKPTYFDSNSITSGYQELTNVYGIPMYKEINPTIFSVTTFPFLFGAMFGDIGHGVILLSISLYMITRERYLAPRIPEFLQILFRGRYLIFFMGLWAVYFGALYMDFIGRPIGKALSAYTPNPDGSLTKSGICFFGIDHAWHHSKATGAVFINSLKMKMSIVIGFAHILLGMLLSAVNESYKKNWVRMWGVVLPQISIFVAIIGYMTLLIILKWSDTSPGRWPNIIGILIEMASMSPLSPENRLFFGQEYLQKGIIAVVALCIPWMLLFTPIVRTVAIRRDRRSKSTSSTGNSGDSPSEEEETMLDLWMHNVIEGVEFLMGLISNISSYLRLWAVSLAHSELSSILYSKTVGAGGGFLLLGLVLVPAWGIATFLLLICLEGLSSTLHSLRLHWVEFGSKFYSGGGTLFKAFSLRPRVLLDPEREANEG